MSTSSRQRQTHMRQLYRTQLTKTSSTNRSSIKNNSSPTPMRRPQIMSRQPTKMRILPSRSPLQSRTTFNRRQMLPDRHHAHILILKRARPTQHTRHHEPQLTDNKRMNHHTPLNLLHLPRNLHLNLPYLTNNNLSSNHDLPTILANPTSFTFKTSRRNHIRTTLILHNRDTDPQPYTITTPKHQIGRSPTPHSQFTT